MARPNHIDLGSSRPFDPARAATPSPRDLPSPRSGDIPPALSPLDAFALQSRLLARKLEDSNLDGHRISRLPPHTIAAELAKSRNGYFNQMSTSSNSNEDRSLQTQHVDVGGEQPAIEKPDIRPISLYPSIQAPDGDRPESSYAHTEDIRERSSLDERWRGLQEGVKPLISRDYVGRTASPDPYLNGDSARIPMLSPRYMSDARGRPPLLQPRKQSTNESLQSNGSSSLYPPRSPAFPRSPGGHSSIRSVRMDSDESDGFSSRGDAPATTYHRSRSPFSPVFAPPRSPSISSEYSVNGGRAPPRQSLNFSRPLSRAGRPSIPTRPSFDSTTKQTEESPQLRPSIDVLSIPDSVDSPGLAPQLLNDGTDGSIPDASIDNEAATASSEAGIGPIPAPSYIYAKYSLPRGRVLSRESFIMPDSTHLFEWNQPFSGSNVSTSSLDAPTSIIRPSTQAQTQPLNQSPFVPPGSNDLIQQQHTRSRSVDGTESASKSWNAPVPLVVPPTPKSSSISTITPSERPRSSTPTTASRRRATPTAARSKAFFAPITALRADSLTPEEHLAEGISCHQEGALQKSTYHLRIAANAGLPTGMLLYALACRHGWGMRPNPGEGVTWLRKAVDTAGMEVAFDEESVAAAQAARQREQGATEAGAQVSGNPAPAPVDFTSRKTHKAQFALSVYELGVSYMNGWGIAQDRPLALRCFEIAGGWGDGDALAEAGFCYAKGVGCKKDLRRAAELYRAAEARGVEMAGNSWIYKDKYMNPPSPSRKSRGRSKDISKSKDDADKPEKKPRDKSRTRTIFGGRKRSATVSTAGATANVDVPDSMPSATLH